MSEFKRDEERPWYKCWPSHIPHSLDYPNVPVWWMLERNIEKYGDKDAVIFMDYKDMKEIDRLTYSKLYNNVVALSVSLRELGINKGDKVATVLPNSPEMITTYYGALMAGATIVPNDQFAKGSELGKTFKASGVKLVVVSDFMLPDVKETCQEAGVKIVVASAGYEIEDIPHDVCRFEELIKDKKEPLSDFTIDPKDDVAVILYTGGTTGEPKGAMLTHRNIVANTIQYARWYDFKPGEEVSVCVIPMSHSGGMSGVMNVPLYSAATLLVMQRANPSLLGKVVEKYRATRLFGVPTLCAAILNSEESCKCDFSSLKACRTGAAPLPVQIKDAFDKLAKKEVLVEAYGITETSPLSVANPIDRPKSGSIGLPLTDTDVKIVDIKTGKEVASGEEGELWIRGPQVMKGYLNKPEETAKSLTDRWFHSGDIARMDDEGYIYIVDRLKDFINASGFKIWPREVEETLYQYPGVKLAAVIGVPDAYRGETVKAFLVPKDDVKGSLNVDDILAFCREKLSSFKVPRIIEFRDELPLSSAGKILRRALRDEEKAKL
ncbi:MAG: long-chain fatty acid--CoA ligase [Deltaproteobacteria bacterium]|nr:long-chain fatty acid--CoA ligase [Deltaproteobacteria bacterium]